MDKFTLEDNVSKLFRAEDFKPFNTNKGVLHLKAEMDVPGPFEEANGELTREGTLLVRCKEDGKRYGTEYLEHGSREDDMELFHGIFDFTIM